jgi:hypothetical protein
VPVEVTHFVAFLQGANMDFALFIDFRYYSWLGNKGNYWGLINRVNKKEGENKYGN